MSERAESSSLPVVICVALLLGLLLVVGGGVAVFVFARQTAMVRAEAERAQEAEIRARLTALAAAKHEESTIKEQRSRPEKPAIDTSSSPATVAIESVLRAQERAWNAGDIDQFMDHYWKSDELTFSSGGKTTRGWNATLQRYRERYPTAEKMGTLKLDDFEIILLSDSAALVLGQWQVARDSEPLAGNFSLVVRRFDDRWLIIHDHTSRLSE